MKMQILYDCYTKEIDNKKFYFVKQLLYFPELNIPKITQGFGMHQNFSKACAIAGIPNANTQATIFEQFQQASSIAKVINLTLPVNQLGKTNG